MSTWHQEQRPQPYWHHTLWTLLCDRPGQHATVERFTTAIAARDAQKLRGGIILPPRPPMNR